MKYLLILLVVLGVAYGGYLGYQEYITTDVSELNENAGSYDGEVVYVRGTVQKNLSILGFGGYILSDGEETILVTSNKGIPKNNSKVTIKGRFRKAVSINGFEYNVLTQGEIED